MLWDHLLCNEPRFTLSALVAFIKLHERHLMSCRDVDSVQALLLRRCVLPTRQWMRAAYAVHEGTPPEMLPRWKPFAPLPVGAVYPPFDGFPAAVINYAQKEVARIRAYENELIRKRLAAQELEKASAALDAAHGDGMAKAEERAAAERAARAQLDAQRAALSREAAATQLASREAALAHAHAAAKRQAEFQQAQAATHNETMASLREELDAAQGHAMRLAKQREEEARLAGIVAKTKAQELDAQQQQAIAHTRQRAEQASRAAKEEIAAREELSAAEHAAALERAAARTAMEGQSRGAAAAAAWEQAAAADVAAEVQAAQLASQLRNAELERERHFPHQLQPTHLHHLPRRRDGSRRDAPAGRRRGEPPREAARGRR